MMLKIGNNRILSAFTLIEVMLTVVILTVGVIGIIRSFISALNSLQISRDYLTETVLAENKMIDTLEDSIANNGSSFSKSQGNFESPYDAFSWALDVSSSDVNGLNLVKVRCFNSNSNPTKDFTLVAYAKSK